MPDQAAGAISTLAGSGIVGTVAVIFLIAFWTIMNRRDEENKKHREELLASLNKKDEKLTTVLETTLTNNTEAMHDNAVATRENTRVLQNVQCLKADDCGNFVKRK